jgi:glycerophosphoryl diester phosphodiesterase
MVSAVDYTIGNFINFLKKEDLLDDTAVFIFPDHLKMGDPSMFDKTGPRDLFFLTNAEFSDQNYDSQSNIFQIDIPQLILRGAEINTNAKFFSSYIKHNKGIFIKDNVSKLSTLNSSALLRHNVWSEKLTLLLDHKLSGDLEIRFGKKVLTVPKNTLSKKAVFLPFTNELRAENRIYDELNKVDHIQPDKLTMVSFVKDNLLQAYLQYGEWKTDTKFSKYKIDFSQEDIDKLCRLPLPNNDRTKKFDQYARDSNRFIAHAGGMIDLNKYTNSLEALDYNYKKGFKLFELDINTSLDGKFLAMHDWSHWKELTGYQGSTPITEEEFLKHNILGKYTPLSMRGINDWFASHQDATLVTDKINNPKAFSDSFIDKDRLMMELFSLDAVEKGISLEIKSAMASGNVIVGLNRKQLKALISKGLTDVAFSRNYLPENPELISWLKQEGVRVYVFHVNFDKSKDEQYVVDYELDYVYGMYADKWNFNNKECSRVSGALCCLSESSSID